MSLLPSTIPIYCLSIKRFPDKRLYFYSYYDHLDILLYSAFRLSWHLAADYPIEMYKGNTFAINEFYKLDKTEQYIINSLLHMRYGQDFNTRLIEHLEIKDIKPIPAALFKFPHAHIWKVIAYFNSLVRHERYGYEVNYQHSSLLKGYFDNKETPLPIEKIDELLNHSIY